MSQTDHISAQDFVQKTQQKKQKSLKPIKLGCLLKGHNKVDQGLLGHNEVYQGITRQIKNEYKLQEITQKKM